MNIIKTSCVVLLFFVFTLVAMAQENQQTPATEKSQTEMSEELMKKMADMMNKSSEQMKSTGEIDLVALKKKYQNALVKIEFTLIGNVEETKMNPTKSERYYSGSEPPHGTGFFISENEILTNAHVIEEARSGSIKIKSPATGGVEFKVDIVGIGSAETIDLAVLRLPEDEMLRFKKRSGLSKISYFEFGDSEEVKQADPVAIFGYPQSSDELKIIQAKVTGRQYLQTQKGRFVCGHQFIEVGPGGVVQPGNSGGPALNRDGKVIGVPSRGAGYAFEQGWIIPSDVVKHFLPRIKNNEAGKKPMELPKLGIALTENFTGTAVWTDAPEDCILFELGVVVREVTPDSLADTWGIKNKDIIIGFANKQKNISCALDFEGYRVITGKMKKWPVSDSSQDNAKNKEDDDSDSDLTKLHISEMVLTSNVGDEITLWYIRKGEKEIQKIEKKMEYKQPVPLPHLGTFEKPDFELWGDFVAQDFNDYNATLFEIPNQEILKGGVVVTFVEPNSLASRRGMEPNHRSTYGFSFSYNYEPATIWVIIDSVNEQKVKNLKELKIALRKCEGEFDQRKNSKDYDPAKKILMKERYVQIGFRTNTFEGNVLELNPAFPIDDALECKKSLVKATE